MHIPRDPVSQCHGAPVCGLHALRPARPCEIKVGGDGAPGAEEGWGPNVLQRSETVCPLHAP